MAGVDYVSLSLTTVLERSLDTTANNIANLSTTGFKAGRPILDAVTLGDGNGESQKASFVQDKGFYLDMDQGELSKTGNPLDIAVSGKDWFSYEVDGGFRVFGRDGRLAVAPDGTLVTSSGAAILDITGGRVSLPPETGTSFVVARDGTVTDESGSILAQIGIFAIDEPDNLRPIGGGLYLPPDGAGAVTSTQSTILQGFLEQSNVQGTLEITRLMEIQRAYERAVKIIDQADQLTRSAIQRISQNV